MKSKEDDLRYTKAMIEYQDKQYLPGYYTGGKMDPYLLAKTKSGGVFLLFSAVLLVAGTIIGFLQGAFTDIWSIIPLVIIYGVYIVVAVIVGLKFLRGK